MKFPVRSLSRIWGFPRNSARSGRTEGQTKAGVTNKGDNEKEQTRETEFSTSHHFASEGIDRRRCPCPRTAVERRQGAKVPTTVFPLVPTSSFLSPRTRSYLPTTKASPISGKDTLASIGPEDAHSMAKGHWYVSFYFFRSFEGRLFRNSRSSFAITHCDPHLASLFCAVSARDHCPKDISIVRPFPAFHEHPPR